MTAQVPFFRPDLRQAEIDEVVSCLRSGWLTTGPRVARFEREFAEAVGARHALAINSCTAALHLAVEGLGLKEGAAVLVPTMTFAATAEVVRYQGAVPVFVDCDPVTGNLDWDDAARRLAQWQSGELPQRMGLDPTTSGPMVGMLPVHVGGLMIDPSTMRDFANRHDLWLVEDAAHAFPAGVLDHTDRLRRCGQGTADATCFSFYANKTITTCEGGMVVTNDEDLYTRMKLMALHGLSHDAWRRYEASGSWDYRILAPGFKYNLTDVAAAIGVHQLARAEEMRAGRERIALRYRELLSSIDEIELPPAPADRLHSWHLFPIRLRTERLSVDRDRFVEHLSDHKIGFSVHWRPLHLHPYYRETYGLIPMDLPQATSLFARLVSLPIYPGLTDHEQEAVVAAVAAGCRRSSRTALSTSLET